MHLRRWVSLVFSIRILKNCKECIARSNTKSTFDNKAKGSNDDYGDDEGK
jgi:hypothetical protein